jgi:hypothetical protein
MRSSLRFLSLVAATVAATGLAGSVRAESGRQTNALVGSSYVFPSVANTQGLFNAFFKTKVTLYNPNTFDIVVQVQLTTTAGAPPTQNLPLAAGGYRRWDNFLQDVFSFTGGGGLIFTESSSKVFVAIVEVYVDGPNGRYTTPVTGLLPDDAILPSSLAPGAIWVAPGIQNNAGNRANFGCLSLAPIASAVQVHFYAFTNGERTDTSFTLNVQSLAWQQQAVPISGDDIIAVFGLTTDDPSLIAYCYAVNVNNASNDGNSIVARRTLPK